MSRRQEEEQGVPVTRKVSISATPTPTGSSIYDAWVEYKGGRTTEVPVGESFEIYARGHARNPGAIVWEVLFTALSDDGSVACYNPTDAWGESYDTPTVKVSANAGPGYRKPPIMPNRDIAIIIKLWGNDTRGQTIPPVEEW